MKSDFSALDRPEVVRFLFHPRRGPQPAPSPGPVQLPGRAEVLLPVAEGVEVEGRFHLGDRSRPNLLFFHGNGEIAADYDELGPICNRMGINFLAFDYRGYGRSGGSPTTTAMMRDCHALFARAGEWLGHHRFSGPLFVMGRSLGSASAIELAHTHPDGVAGLIIESGFAFAAPLLRRLGIDPAAVGFKEETAFRHIEKIGRWRKPLLVIHAEFDHIIPFTDGKALFDACPAPRKELLRIPGADHNSIFMHGLDAYLSALARLVSA
ncbi:MAG: lysophospholipase [Desulfobacterales bacterium]|jgi:hypothetical protein|nr:lysophospholipase [Desulfobacterales bacterium]